MTVPPARGASWARAGPLMPASLPPTATRWLTGPRSARPPRPAPVRTAAHASSRNGLSPAGYGPAYRTVRNAIAVLIAANPLLLEVGKRLFHGREAARPAPPAQGTVRHSSHRRILRRASR